MENVVTDIHELEKGMDLVSKEEEIRGNGKERGSGKSVVMRDLIENYEEKMRRIK
jgi:ABC-type antimicrobial peptide transport system ATPase subunit